ncbi:proton-coupled folate transporter [Elysia marginata]|uniref:Proton-coupled folate transporter n=1 Tax=Elysia marginata TaxID=1093978 RepID=A0AAV4G459_9GAST|nr:proton-coupled folate transporter [Elysia marginata]
MEQHKEEYQYIQRADSSLAGTKRPPKPNTIEKLPYVLINTFIIIFTVSDRNRVVLLNQYLYHRFARDVSGNVSIDTTSRPCGNESDLASSESDTSRVQRMTSSMIMNFELVVSLLGVLGSLFLGTFSTSLGRKAQLLIPISGYTVRALSILAVAFWDLPLSWLYVGCVAEGIMGGAPGVYLGVFLYVSDITPRNRKRTLGLALLEGIRGIMGSGINIASGQMIQRATFLVPASFTASGATLW